MSNLHLAVLVLTWTALATGCVIALIDAVNYFFPLHEDEERPLSVVMTWWNARAARLANERRLMRELDLMEEEFIVAYSSNTTRF